MAERYEIVIEYEGKKEGAVDFARELNNEFGCDLVINRVNNKGQIIKHMIEWEGKTDKVDKTG